MKVTYVQGDIFLTHAQAIAVGLNAAGRVEVTPLFTTLQDRYPVFVSEYRKRGRSGELAPGDVWVWREGRPWLVGMIVRETPQGATRLRYVEMALLHLYQNWERESLRSLALARLEASSEWLAMRDLVADYLGQTGLSVMVYDTHQPGIAAATPHDPDDTHPDVQGDGRSSTD